MQNRISETRSIEALGWRLQFITNLLSYFLSGWPDFYSSANSHHGVYRVKTGCAPACRSALSARVIFLGSCFHDKIFSDSIFAYKPLKVCFCLMSEFPLFGIQPAFWAAVLRFPWHLHTVSRNKLCAVFNKATGPALKRLSLWQADCWSVLHAKQIVASVRKAIGCVCGAVNYNYHNSLWSSCSQGPLLKLVLQVSPYS